MIMGSMCVIAEHADSCGSALYSYNHGPDSDQALRTTSVKKLFGDCHHGHSITVKVHFYTYANEPTLNTC